MHQTQTNRARFLALATAITLVGTLGAAQPIHADDTATVTLVVHTDDSLLFGHHEIDWTDDMTWTAGMTALDLLDAVVEARDSTYTVTWFDLDGDGTVDDAFVDEIDGVATDFTLLLVGMYWAIYENGDFASSGVGQLELEPGDVITLNYEGYPATI